MTSVEPETRTPTVWILGAGFSQALGGPLIKQLLGQREREVLKGVFPMGNHDLPIDGILAAGAFFRHGLEGRRGYWEDAEQFLDIVESAVAEVPGLSHAHMQLTKMLKGTVLRPEAQPSPWGGSKFYEFDNLNELTKACRRALALDCSLFLRNVHTNSERWAPYRQWAEDLTFDHTVVTFNYDQVPELLAELPDSKLMLVHPNQVQTDLETAKSLRKAPVLKVHGSVTWRLGEKGPDGKQRIDVIANMKDRTIGDPGVDPVLGVPGPGKRDLVRGSLNDLWEAALSAVRAARNVFFVGYRFPPTDADSRAGLIRAVSDNRFKDRVRISTIVGPSINGPDAVRLHHLLDAATSGSVRAVPLYAQDFIGLWRSVPRLTDRA